MFLGVLCGLGDFRAFWVFFGCFGFDLCGLCLLCYFVRLLVAV